MAPHFNNADTSLLRRFTAALSIALLLLLNVAAVSPALHEHLHEHDADHMSASHACAVVLFGNGLVLDAASVHTAPPAPAFIHFAPRATTIVVAAPPHRLPPGRAPPAC